MAVGVKVHESTCTLYLFQPPPPHANSTFAILIVSLHAKLFRGKLTPGGLQLANHILNRAQDLPKVTALMSDCAI
jgi:hypothetical protein